MTFVGRILVVVHLILSVIFMAFAGAVFTAHTNFAKKAKTAADALAKVQDELKGARGEAEKQKSADDLKIKELLGQVTELSGERTGLQQKIAGLETENKNLNNLFDAEREMARLSTEESTDRTAESTLQRTKNAELYQSRNEIFADLKKAEDKIFAMDLQRQQIEEKYSNLLRDVAVMRAFLASKQLPTDVKQMASTAQPPTDVEGVVLDYRKAERGSNEFVEISIGSDDDLRIGHRLTVYNNDKYLGTIQLQKVTPDRAVGLVIKKTKNTTIKKGDNVSTKL